MMKRLWFRLWIILPASLFFLLSGALPADAAEAIKYFRVDKVVTVTGEITDIKSEKSYRKNNFINIYLKEKKTDHLFKIEVSPDWFFNLDLLKGQQIQVTGSVCSMKGNSLINENTSNVSNLNSVNNTKPGKFAGQLLIMTQSLVFQGQIFHFRDKSGFPLWRGKGRQYKSSGHRQQRQKGRKRSGGMRRF
jgi:hypothetical protein